MIFHILTLFPEIIQGYFSASIMAKAVDRGVIDGNIINIRDYAMDKHKTCDDAPYGGGPGMVLKPEPLALALDTLKARKAVTIYPTPGGCTFNQEWAGILAREKELIFICGRYEGIDQRIIDEYVDYEISIGDYILSSGEIGALVLIDAIYRLKSGIISSDSLKEESFHEGLLEYPHYTRPEVFCGKAVPEVLLSGHHGNIEKWRQQKKLEKTEKNRPDLYRRYLKNTVEFKGDKTDGCNESN